MFNKVDHRMLEKYPNLVGFGRSYIRSNFGIATCHHHEHWVYLSAKPFARFFSDTRIFSKTSQSQ